MSTLRYANTNDVCLFHMSNQTMLNIYTIKLTIMLFL